MEKGKWGTANYLESLHRTYNKPLPKRNDGDFERALDFRNKEKAHYSKLTEENDKLRYLLQQAKRDHSELLFDADKLRTSWETSNHRIREYEELNLSKSNVDADVPTAGSSSNVHDHVEVQNTGRGNDGSVGSEGKGRGKGGDDEVPGKVLSADLPDSSGHAEEHASEGRQSEDRAGDASEGGGTA